MITRVSPPTAKDVAAIIGQAIAAEQRSWDVLNPTQRQWKQKNPDGVTRKRREVALEAEVVLRSLRAQPYYSVGLIGKVREVSAVYIVYLAQFDHMAQRFLPQLKSTLEHEISQLDTEMGVAGDAWFATGSLPSPAVTRAYTLLYRAYMRAVYRVTNAILEALTLFTNHTACGIFVLEDAEYRGIAFPTCARPDRLWSRPLAIQRPAVFECLGECSLICRTCSLLAGFSHSFTRRSSTRVCFQKKGTCTVLLRHRCSATLLQQKWWRRWRAHRVGSKKGWSGRWRRTILCRIGDFGGGGLG